MKGGTADDEGSVQLRGVGEQAWAVRPQVKIVEGRKFTPGLRELIVGRGAARQFAGLTPGSEVRLGTQPWKVAGVFASGDSMESEIWGDAASSSSTLRTRLAGCRSSPRPARGQGSSPPRRTRRR